MATVGAAPARRDKTAPGRHSGAVPELAVDRVVLIYNPNSTGDAPEVARALDEQLTGRFADLPVHVRPTEHAGHARDLAREAAGEGCPLIVSVSGDGGYNEVVNGIMDAGNPDVTAAVVAAGNANDHRRITKEHPLPEAISLGTVTRMDLLRMTFESGGRRETRYAHSYIGVGLTPVVAVDLEKGNKGSLREIVTVVRTFRRFRPFRIELDSGRRMRIDSLVFANIPQMAKVATLSENGSPDDGRFEVITLAHLSKWRVLGTAVRAATRGLGPQPTAREYGFIALQPMPLQMDGEVLRVEAGSRVRVEIAASALRTLR